MGQATVSQKSRENTSPPLMAPCKHCHKARWPVTEAIFNITIPGRPQRILLGYIFRYRCFKWFAKVYTARMQWIEAWSNLGSLKAESELLTTTIMLYPAGMATCVSPDLMQEQEIFFAKLLCNRQRTSVILITPLTSSSVSGCFAGNSFHQIFHSPKIWVWRPSQGQYTSIW